MAEQLAICCVASQVAGGLRAGSLKTATTKERLRVENSTKYAGQEKLKQLVCDEIHQMKYLIINDIENGTLAVMQEQQRQYDDQFFTQTKEILDGYPQPSGIGDDFPDPNVFAKIHSDHVSKVRSTPYPGESLLPDQARMELRRYLEEKLEVPLQCKIRKLKFNEFLGDRTYEKRSQRLYPGGDRSCAMLGAPILRLAGSTI